VEGNGTDPQGTFEIDGEATLFGFDPTPLHAKITARTKTWRMGGAARTMGLFLVIAPFLAIFPPHAVWPIGMLLTGGMLARRRYIERFTLQAVEGTCPKCGKPLVSKPTRLRTPHAIPCDECHFEPTLRFPAGALAQHAAA
jgi:hypothetical protein